MLLMKSRQDIFNEVSLYAMSAFEKWGEDARSKATVVPGISPNNGCYYRHPDEERRCFVGCLIPDDKFSELMESCSIATLFDKFADIMKEIGLRSSMTEFLQDLQIIHDNYVPALWLRQLRSFADLNGLVYPDCLILEGG